MKTEIRHIWGPFHERTRSEMRTIMFDYIETFYNRTRHQASLEPPHPIRGLRHRPGRLIYQNPVSIRSGQLHPAQILPVPERVLGVTCLTSTPEPSSTARIDRSKWRPDPRDNPGPKRSASRHRSGEVGRLFGLEGHRIISRSRPPWRGCLSAEGLASSVAAHASESLGGSGCPGR